jgi:hypothetical protein
MITGHLEKLRRDSLVSLLQQLNTGAELARKELFDTEVVGKSWSYNVLVLLRSEGWVEQTGSGIQIKYVIVGGKTIPTDEETLQRLITPGRQAPLSREVSPTETPGDGSEGSELEPAPAGRRDRKVTDALNRLNTRLDLLEQGMGVILEKIMELHNEFFPRK